MCTCVFLNVVNRHNSLQSPSANASDGALSEASHGVCQEEMADEACSGVAAARPRLGCCFEVHGVLEASPG